MEQKVVIKIGSTVMAGKTGNIDTKCISGLVEQCVNLRGRGFKLLLVVSGAVKLGNSVFVEKTAAAAVGQVNLMVAWQRVAARKKLLMGQLLLRRNDLRQTKTREMIEETIMAFWRLDGMVLVNENDVVELNSFGGNDYLSLALARLINAETVIFLSHVQGLLDKNKEVVARVNSINRRVWQWVDDRDSEGVGGMTAKLKVAKACLEEKRKLIIVDGKEKNILTDLLLKKRQLGTIFERQL